MSQVAEPEEQPDARELLAMDPAEVIRRYPDRALALADRARDRGMPKVADGIEARVAAVQEGSV